jgi:hypothetical protein
MKSKYLKYLILASVLAFGTAVPNGAPAAVQMLPNLVPSWPSSIQIGAADAGSPYAFALRFTTRVENTGAFPFDLLASPDDPSYLDEQGAVAQECVSWTVRLCQEREPVGTFSWSTSHQHYHITNFARYELRRLIDDPSTPEVDPHEIPDMSPSGSVTSGGKVTFCMEDSGGVGGMSYTNPNSAAIYESCDAVLQGISSGNYDEYPYNLDGQQLSLNDVNDGYYAIVVTVNPLGNFLETTRSDDVAWTRIYLSGGGTRVTVI